MAKYWSFSFSISPSNGHPGLISFRMDWLDLLEVQGTLENLLQHHSSKASVFRRSAFFTVQLSHPYMTTGKTIALTRWTFVGKVMSMIFNLCYNSGKKNNTPLVNYTVNSCLPHSTHMQTKCVCVILSYFPTREKGLGEWEEFSVY